MWGLVVVVFTAGCVPSSPVSLLHVALFVSQTFVLSTPLPQPQQRAPSPTPTHTPQSYKMLLQRHQALGVAARGRPAAVQIAHTSRCRVRVAAGGEGGGKPIREFREDSGEIVVGGEQKKADNELYADQVAQAVSDCAMSAAQGLACQQWAGRGAAKCLWLWRTM